MVLYLEILGLLLATVIVVAFVFLIVHGIVHTIRSKDKDEKKSEPVYTGGRTED